MAPLTRSVESTMWIDCPTAMNSPYKALPKFLFITKAPPPLSSPALRGRMKVGMLFQDPAPTLLNFLGSLRRADHIAG